MPRPRLVRRVQALDFGLWTSLCFLFLSGDAHHECWQQYFLFSSLEKRGLKVEGRGSVRKGLFLISFLHSFAQTNLLLSIDVHHRNHCSVCVVDAECRHSRQTICSLKHQYQYSFPQSGSFPLFSNLSQSIPVCPNLSQACSIDRSLSHSIQVRSCFRSLLHRATAQLSISLVLKAHLIHVQAIYILPFR